MAVPKKRKTVEEYALAFIAALKCGVEHIAHAARIYVEALDDENINNVQFRKICEEKAPFVPAGFWRGVERVGRGREHWKLLLSAGVPHEAKIRRLPLSVQSDIVEGVKFEMLTVNNEVLKVDVRTISKEQARRVFANDHIRNIAEQKAWLAEHATPTEEPNAEPLPIRRLSKGHWRVLKDVILTRPDLKRMLMDT